MRLSLKLILLKELLKNKVGTLTIYKLIKLMHNYRYFKRKNHLKYLSKKKLTAYFKKWFRFIF